MSQRSQRRNLMRYWRTCCPRTHFLHATISRAFGPANDDSVLCSHYTYHMRPDTVAKQQTNASTVMQESSEQRCAGGSSACPAQGQAMRGKSEKQSAKGTAQPGQSCDRPQMHQTAGHTSRRQLKSMCRARGTDRAAGRKHAGGKPHHFLAGALGSSRRFSVEKIRRVASAGSRMKIPFLSSLLVHSLCTEM
jgi:hypothetical protein